MAKKFYKRSILKPEKTKEEEEWEKKQEEKDNLKNKKQPTAIFDGINYDNSIKNMEDAILKDISQDGREEDDEWVEERN